MNELTDTEVSRMWDRYSTVLIEHNLRQRDRRYALAAALCGLVFLGLAFLLWRVW